MNMNGTLFVNGHFEGNQLNGGRKNSVQTTICVNMGKNQQPNCKSGIDTMSLNPQTTDHLSHYANLPVDVALR